MQIIIFGGINEIGGNKILLESDDKKARIFLDFGRRLNLTSSYYQEFIQPRQKNLLRDFLKLGAVPKISNIYRNDLLQIDFTLINENARDNMPPIEKAPDFWEFSELLTDMEEEPPVSGIFVTHAHFDHIQDISFLRPDIPIYCSEKTKIMIEAITDISPSKIENEFFKYYDYDLSSKSLHYRSTFPYSLDIIRKGSEGCKKILCSEPELDLELTVENPPKERIFNIIDEKNSVSMDPFTIEAISVDHSLPGALSFLVTDKKSNKRILYSGDFKFGGLKSQKINDYIKRVKKDGNINAFICEGTRIYKDIIGTEKAIGKNILEKMKTIKKLILIDFNWKDLGRLNLILNCCKKLGRKLLISPKTAYLLFQFHQKFPNEYTNPIEEENLGTYIKRRRNLLYSPNEYSGAELGFISYWGKNVSQEDRNITRIRHMLDILESKIDKSKEKYTNDLGYKHKKYFEILNKLIKDWFGELNEKELIEKLKTIWNLATFHFEKGIRAYEVRNSPEKYVLMFTFWDVNELFDISPKDGDMTGSHFIKANTEPFNDELLIDEQKMIRWLDHFKIKYECEPAPEDPSKIIFLREHVSGHASGSEIKKIISELNPQIVIPVHTIFHNEFKQIANEIGVKIVFPEFGKPIMI